MRFNSRTQWSVTWRVDAVNQKTEPGQDTSPARGVTRRTLIKGAAGAGLAVGVTYAVPTITSVGAKAAFAQVSVVPTPTPEIDRVELSELSPTARALSPGILTFSEFGDVTADLIFASLGKPEDFTGIDASGKIALIERGEILFSEKVANAAADGAIGVVIYNRVPGLFTGNLSTLSAIPAVSLSQEEGLLLKAELDAGSVVRVNLKVVSA
jgi:hypothetical protein